MPCWAAIVAWGIFAIADGPEEPPSAAAELQRMRRASTQRSLASMGHTPDSGAVQARRLHAASTPPHSGPTLRPLQSLSLPLPCLTPPPLNPFPTCFSPTPKQQVWENAVILLGDSNFMCLAWSVSILTGMGYAYLTVIGQMLGPCGYSDTLVGDSIAAFSAANAVGCILYVYILSHEGSSRSYTAYQVWFSAALALCLAIALVTASPGEPIIVVVILWSVLGMAAGPLVRVLSPVAR